MDKFQLFAMLASQAPKLLKAIQTPISGAPDGWGDGLTPIDPLTGNDTVLMEMIGNRGYDPGLIEDNLSNATTPPIAAYDEFRQLDREMRQASNDQTLFPSVRRLGWDSNEAELDAPYSGVERLLLSNLPAAVSAKTMMLHDPNNSPIQLRNLVSGDMTLNERINSKAMDNALGLGTYQTSNPDNEVFALNNPQAAIDANYKAGQMFGIVPFEEDSWANSIDEHATKRNMFRMLMNRGR